MSVFDRRPPHPPCSAGHLLPPNPAVAGLGKDHVHPGKSPDGWEKGGARDIAQIHVAKKALGLDDATYRAALATATGKTSSADMTPAERQKVLAHFRDLGFRPEGSGRPFRPSPHAHVRKVFALWRACAAAGAVESGRRTALAAFVVRMGGPPDPDWMTPAQAQPVIEALKDMERRAKGASL